MSGRRVPPRRVFLSHTAELARLPAGGSFVAVAESAVIRAGHVPVDMGHFAADEAPPAQVCREAVRSSDVFVLIAGFRYGSPVVDDPRRSYTELEHDTAQEAGMTRRIFVLGDRTTGPAEMFCDGTHCSRQRAFRERLRTSGATVATVHSTDELGLALFQSLMTLPTDGPPRRRLHSIPAGRIKFVGREEVLDHITAGLDGDGRVVAVTGMGGLGKTSTVIEYAHRHREAYDIAWWIRGADPEMVPAGLAELARTLDLATQREPDQVAVSRLFGLLAHHDRWLLVFDDVQDGRTLARYRPRGPGHVLVTSRSSAWHGVASATVEMPIMDRSESIAVLRTWAPGISEADADLVADAVGDLPQVIDQAGSWLTVGGLTAQEYLRLLDERAAEVHSHDPGGVSPPVAATWALTFDQLADDDAAAMDLLTVIAWLGPAPVPRAVLARRPGQPDVLPTRLATVLADPLLLAEKIGVLHRRCMLVASTPVLMHRVPAGLLRARCAPPTGSPPWPALAVRLLRSALPDDVWDNPGRWQVWRDLLPHVRAVTDTGRDTGTVREDVAWLVDRMATYLQTTGNPRAALPLFRRAVEAGRAQHGDDHRTTLFHANNLANNLRELGLHREASALNRETLARRRRTLGDDHEDTLKSAKNVALDLFDTGEFDTARALDADTLARRRQVLGPDHEDTLNVERNLANNLRELGDHDQARALHEDTLHRLRRKLGDDHPRTLQCACDLADDLHAAGDHPRALAVHEDTLARRRRVLGDDHPHTLVSAHHLARTLAATGDDARARELLDATLAARRRVLGDDHPDTVATGRDLVVDGAANAPDPR